MLAALEAKLAATEATLAALKNSPQGRLAAALTLILRLRGDLNTANHNYFIARTELARVRSANAQLQTKSLSVISPDPALISRLTVISNSLDELTLHFRQEFNPAFQPSDPTLELQVSNLVSTIEKLNLSQQWNVYQQLSTNSVAHPSGF